MPGRITIREVSRIPVSTLKKNCLPKPGSAVKYLCTRRDMGSYGKTFINFIYRSENFVVNNRVNTRKSTVLACRYIGYISY